MSKELKQIKYEGNEEMFVGQKIKKITEHTGCNENNRNEPYVEIKMELESGLVLTFSGCGNYGHEAEVSMEIVSEKEFTYVELPVGKDN